MSRLRVIGASLIVYALSVCPVVAQSGVAWDASPDSTVTGYVVTVNGVQLGTTSGLFLPWTIPAGTHQVCVSSQAGTLIGPANCINYTAQVSGTSTNGATATVGSGQVVDAAGHVWTLRVATATTQGRETDRDGEHVGGGYGDLLLWWNGNIYVQAFDTWWLWVAGSWSQIQADPRTQLPPPTPPPVPPSPPSWNCTIPAAVKRYANGDKQYTFRCPPDTPFVKGDSVKTAKP